MTCLFAVMLELLCNIYLDLKLDWYGYFEKGAQWTSMLIIFGIYPAANAIFLNYYQRMKTRVQQFWYIIGCSVFAVVYEWLAEVFGFFYRNEWKLWYSVIVYPFLFLLLVGVLKFVRKLLASEYTRS
ncbi:hypothetical protein JI721_14190 [Alicyclobacillus cycloheptanicus]|nr:hypothetical protein JI721_14190 [Alicyclobacillus cycloheptanicus]